MRRIAEQNVSNIGNARIAGLQQDLFIPDYDVRHPFTAIFVKLGT